MASRGTGAAVCGIVHGGGDDGMAANADGGDDGIRGTRRGCRVTMCHKVKIWGMLRICLSWIAHMTLYCVEETRRGGEFRAHATHQLESKIQRYPASDRLLSYFSPSCGAKGGKLRMQRSRAVAGRGCGATIARVCLSSKG